MGCPDFRGMTRPVDTTTLLFMAAAAPESSTEPTRTLRIARACATPDCGTVYYVAAVADGARCPVCSGAREHYELSA